MDSTRDVILQTPDMRAAVAFYDALGLARFVCTDELAGYETGAFRLFIEPGTAPGPVFEFLVDDVPAAKARLLAAGCTLVEENPAIPRCYLRDPFGLTFNLAKTKG
jgi:catechol 2,3-dioxygenase-like lactoylglutathione lyase family enzyme